MHNWKKAIIDVVMIHGNLRKDGEVASEKTKSNTIQVVISAFRDLHRLGYKVLSPHNLKGLLVELLMKD